MLRARLAVAVVIGVATMQMGGCTDSKVAAPPEDPPVEEPIPLPALAFAGSESCKGCHAAAYNKWRHSGHPYKLVEVKNGQPPSYPFTKLPSPPNGMSWGQVLYVVGGYGYKARFVGLDGNFITQSGKNQWDLNTLAWSDYEKDKVKPYDCGSCHTTGYSAQGNQKGISGLIGTWQEDGVGCEACHGQGNQHVARPATEKLRVDRSIEACASCHHRNGATNPEITAQNGFLMHRDALHSIRNTAGHASMSCVTCHDPHAGALFSRERGTSPVVRTCDDCHSKARTAMQSGSLKAWKGNAECTACHMAEMTVAAVPGKPPWKGDMKSHLVAINVDPAAPQFYGTNNNRSFPYITLGFACLKCHDGKSQEWAAEQAIKVHKW